MRTRCGKKIYNTENGILIHKASVSVNENGVGVKGSETLYQKERTKEFFLCFDYTAAVGSTVASPLKKAGQTESNQLIVTQAIKKIRPLTDDDARKWLKGAGYEKSQIANLFNEKDESMKPLPTKRFNAVFPAELLDAAAETARMQGVSLTGLMAEAITAYMEERGAE